MINETSLIVNGSIPLKVILVSTTNWVQFAATVLYGLLGAFGLIFIMYLPKIWAFFSFSTLSSIARLTKRNVIMIKHTRQELFGSSMIDEKTFRNISEAMNEMEGEDFDLVLHTPGGEIFSSLAISRLIKQYPGKVRAIVPMYSMSGGSLLAFSCKEILMTPNASLGPIDPQLGSLFRYGSAAAWDKIVKFKGKKAEDQSISFAMMGQQYTKSIQLHLAKIIDFDLNVTQKSNLINFLTDGSVEHAYPLTINDLAGFGVKAGMITDKKLLDKLSDILSSSGKEGVHYYKIPKWRKKLWQA